MKKILLSLLLLNGLSALAQCTFPATNTIKGAAITLCVKNLLPSENTTLTINSTEFALLNVVQGFSYSFSVGNINTTGIGNENINIYDAANSPLVNTIGTNGVTLNWTATFSGEIKVIASRDCNHTAITNFNLTIQLVSIGNTFDNQNTSGTNTWVGHVYNWVGGGLPPGGASTTSPSATFPFTPENYVGYYTINSQDFVEGFGGNSNCFNTNSAGTIRTAVQVETFAVRYRMNSTLPAGCYIIRFKGDDGIRFYNDNVLVFNEWKQQSPTSYSNILVYLDGNAELVFDFYENNGQNVADISIQPFDTSLNAIATPANPIVCNNVSPGSLDGSTFTYNGGSINPSIGFQWQVSTDNVTFTNITGATAENYIVPATTTAGIRYYRREIRAISSVGNCNSYSNTVSITTSNIKLSAPNSLKSTAITCTSFTANWNAVTNADSYAMDIATANTFAAGSFVGTYNNFNVGNVTTFNVTGLMSGLTYYYRIRAIFTCGSATSATANVQLLGIAPTANAATNVDCGSFSANWNALSGATNYYIDVATTSTFATGTFLSGYQNLNVGNVTTITLTDVAISPLYYRVRSEGSCGTSVSSAVITVNPKTSTWNGTAWSNGIPTLGTYVILNGDYNTATNGNLEACNLVVNTGFTAVISSEMFFNVQNNITNNGTLTVENKGSLVQINNTGTNIGAISYERITTGKPLDYVYWSSPVVNFSTPTSGLIFKWSPAFNNPNGGQGYWLDAKNTIMQTGVGYIMRDVFSRNFVGVPHNGINNTQISRGSDLNAGIVGPNGILRSLDDDNWNLIGNPYPSAISINSFLTENTNIDGFVKVWSHGTSPSTAISNPFYEGFVANYTTSDYITFNGTGNTFGAGLLDVIGAAQSFMVLMKPTGADVQTVTFNNAMRGKLINNSQFYRNANASTSQINKNRIWLDLANANGNSDRTLFAYVEGATASRDRLFDAVTEVFPNTQRIFTTIGNEKFNIQSLGLTFIDTDVIPLGIEVPQQGIYSISIHDLDGLFENQPVYVKDELTGLTNSVNEQPYYFTANKGANNDRLSLVFRSSALNSNDFQTAENAVYITQENQLTVHTKKENITSVIVHDALGRILANKKQLDASEVILDSILKTNTALFIKIELQNGQIIAKKVIF